MKQRLGAVARGFAVTALSGLLAAGGCISQRANESESAANAAVVETSRVASIDQNRALSTVRGLRSNMTSRTRYLGPADPASSYATGTTFIGSNASASPMINEQNNASPSVATNVTGPVTGPAYYLGTATGTAVNAGVAGTNLTGTAIVPGPVAMLGSGVVGGLAPGVGVIGDMGATVPAVTTGVTGASAAATVKGTGGTLAQPTVTNVTGTAGTVTSPGVAGPLSAQTFNTTAPLGVAPANTSTAAAGVAASTGAGVAGTITAPGIAGPVSTRTLTGTATLGTGTSTQMVVTPRSSTTATSNATITNGTGGAKARVVLRPSTGSSNATVNATTTTTSTGARVMLGATPIAVTRDANGHVVVTNQTVNQH